MIIDGTRSNDRAIETVLHYYSALNRGDWEGMLALLAEAVVHDLNQGRREVGKGAFAARLQRMHAHYRERLRDIVVMAAPDGCRVAAEFVIHGEYVADDTGMPIARGQRYVLPGGAFFELHDGVIARISSYCNLRDWLSQLA